MGFDPQKRPYVDDPNALVKTRNRLAALRLATKHDLRLVIAGRDGERRQFTYEEDGVRSLVSESLTWPIIELAIHQYLTRSQPGRDFDRPCRVRINQRGEAALARWTKNEEKR